MADFSQTIVNSVNSFGPAPASKWGTGSPYTFTWGTSLWGEGTEDLISSFEKLWSDSVTPTDAVAQVEFEKGISESISSSMETSQETLGLGPWLYVFPSQVTNLEERTLPTWTAGSAATTSMTCSTAASTTWT